MRMAPCLHSDPEKPLVFLPTHLRLIPVRVVIHSSLVSTS